MRKVVQKYKPLSTLNNCSLFNISNGGPGGGKHWASGGSDTIPVPPHPCAGTSILSLLHCLNTARSATKPSFTVFQAVPPAPLMFRGISDVLSFLLTWEELRRRHMHCLEHSKAEQLHYASGCASSIPLMLGGNWARASSQHHRSRGGAAWMKPSGFAVFQAVSPHPPLRSGYSFLGVTVITQWCHHN